MLMMSMWLMSIFTITPHHIQLTAPLRNSQEWTKVKTTSQKMVPACKSGKKDTRKVPPRYSAVLARANLSAKLAKQPVTTFQTYDNEQEQKFNFVGAASERESTIKRKTFENFIRNKKRVDLRRIENEHTKKRHETSPEHNRESESEQVGNIVSIWLSNSLNKYTEGEEDHPSPRRYTTPNPKSYSPFPDKAFNYDISKGMPKDIVSVNDISQTKTETGRERGRQTLDFQTIPIDMPMKVRSIRNSNNYFWNMGRYENDFRAQTLHNMSVTINEAKGQEDRLNPRRLYKGLKAKAKPKPDSCHDQVVIEGWNSSVEVNDELTCLPFGH